MTSVNVYNDGKLGRGIKAKVITVEPNKMLIEFHDFMEEKDITVWFERERDEGQFGVFSHEPTNTWFYEERETEQFIRESREWLSPEYHELLFPSN